MSDIRFNAMCKLALSSLKKAREDQPCISAGELAKRMGISRTTAKKYLAALVKHGAVSEYDFVHVNGQPATAYIPNRAGR